MNTLVQNLATQPPRRLRLNGAQAPMAPEKKSRVTRLERAPGVSHADADLAMLALALAGDEAAALLEGLNPSHRLRALEALSQARALEGPLRQAKLHQTFGLRPEMDGNLRLLMAELGPAMQAAVFRRLPFFQRTLFRNLSIQPGVAAGPAVEAWAQRLLQEARG